MPKYNGEHEDVIRPFVDGMRHKLANNKFAGKKRWEEDTAEVLLDRLKSEVMELEEAIKGGNTIEMLLEACDIANFAMMVATVAIKRASQGQGSNEWAEPKEMLVVPPRVCAHPSNFTQLKVTDHSTTRLCGLCGAVLE